MKITLGQFQPIIGKKEENLKRIEKVLRKAAKDKADIVLFPELCLTGYFIQDTHLDLAETVDGPSLNYVKRLCKELGLYTVLAWPEKSGDKIYNSACLISKEGKIIGNYRKIHLYDREKEIFEMGNQYKVFETDIGNIGIMICFDLDFPEVARILSLKGADVILIPTNNFLPYHRYQETYVKSRSMENEIPVAICNRTGKEQDLEYFGESAVYDSRGYQMVKLDHVEKTETVTIQINEEKDENLVYQQERKPRTYTEISKI